MAGAIRLDGPRSQGVSLLRASQLSQTERKGVLPRRHAVAYCEAWWPPQALGGTAFAPLVGLALALGGRLTDDLPTLRARVLDAVREGRVVALRGDRGDVASGAAPSAVADHNVRAADRERETNTWITVRLVDDGDPALPIAFARYRITLPDASVRTGRLDAMGVAHIEGIDPGTCAVSFPDFDADAWEPVP